MLKLSIVETHFLDPRLSHPWTTVFTVLILATIAMGLQVQKSIFKMVKRRKGRGINGFIFAQQVKAL